MTEVPVTICWHCDRAVDRAMDANHKGAVPHEGALSLCVYCGAVAVFGADLQLIPPSKELLDELQDNQRFRGLYAAFSWARQYLMIKGDGLMRDRQDPDR